MLLLLSAQFLLLELAFSNEATISITKYGCTTKTGCTRLCRIGIANCDDTKRPLCEYGYFKFTLNDGWDCVMCPYGLFKESQVLSCMDCFENPYIWENSRVCSYYYQIQNGNPSTGAYIRKNMAFKELYLVNKATTPLPPDPSRAVEVQYETYRCDGCENFCVSGESEDCHSLPDADLVYSGITCQDGFIFSGDGCTLCQVENCILCSEPSICTECKTGYFQDSASGLCIKCQPGCLQCSVDESSVEYCSNCLSKIFVDFRIYSLSQTSCEMCGFGCARCEYVTFKTDSEETLFPNREYGFIADASNYHKRCRQCLYNGFVIDSNAVDCKPCQISNCELCYFASTGGLSTLVLNFEPFKNGVQKCAKCKSGFKVSADELSCQAYTPAANCVSQNKAAKCNQCAKAAPPGNAEFMLAFFDVANPQCVSGQKCTDKLKNCISCIAYLDSANKPAFQCTICEGGYYPDLWTGLCIPCQSKCTSCWQYTDSYNITEYLRLQKPGNNFATFLADFQKLVQEPINDPLCTQCSEGFDLYNNQCLGCTDDCMVLAEPTNPASRELTSACSYDVDFAYCSSCFIPQNQRSLTPDLSSCQDCPTYCLACRQRTADELQAVNPFFNPSLAVLQKYGLLCYRMQNIKPTQNIFLDSVLGVPVSCLATEPTTPLTALEKGQKCKKAITYKIRITCDDSKAYPTADYKLSTFYSKKGSLAEIRFNKLDKAENYQAWNSQAVQEIQLNIYFIRDDSDTDEQFVCSMPKPTQIVTDLQLNIFTLRTLKIKLIGAGGLDEKGRVLLRTNGLISLQNFATVEFNNINVENSADKTYGLRISGQRTEFKFSQGKLLRRLSNIVSASRKAYLKLQLQNCVSLTLENVMIDLQFTTVSDPIIELNKSSQFDLSQLTIREFTITQARFTSHFYQANYLASLNQIKIDGFQILRVVFDRARVFSDPDENNLIEFSASKVKMSQVEFISGSFISSNKITSLSLSNFEMAASLLQLNSILIESPSIQITYCYFYKVVLDTKSLLIKSMDRMTNEDKQITGMSKYLLKFATFQSLECKGDSTLAQLSSPDNSKSQRADVEITSLRVIEVEISEVDIEKQKQVTFALFSITNVGNVEMRNISILDTLGITIFFVYDLKNFTMSRALCDWTKPQLEIQPKPVANEDDVETPIQNPESPVDNTVKYVVPPINNLFPVNSDCTQRKLKSNSFSYYFLFLSSFNNRVLVEYVDIRRLLLIDASAIYIDSFGIRELLSNETIIIQNCQFNYNKMLTYTNGVDMSLIQIISEQSQNIQLLSLIFQSNHLHQQLKTQTSQTPACFLISSTYGVVKVVESFFQYNRVTKSTNGIIFIQSQQIYFDFNSFLQTNLMDILWADLLEEQQMKNENLTLNIKSYFEVMSQGGVLNLQGQKIDIFRCLFQDSYGTIGSTIYADVVDGYLNVSNTSISNSQGSLEPQYQSKGGCIFIDSSSSQLEMRLQALRLVNCISRTSGGCIYMLPTKFSQKIYIKDSTFTKCQSFGRSVLELQFLESSETPYVELDNVIITNNNYEQFLSNIPELAPGEKFQLSEATSLFYQNTGTLILKNTQISQMKYIQLISGKSLSILVFDNLQVYNNEIFILPLFQFSFDNELSSATLVNSGFRNNTATEFKGREKYQCSQTGLEKFKYTVPKQVCDNTLDMQQLYLDIQIESEVSFDHPSHDEAFFSKSQSEKYGFPNWFTIYQTEVTEAVSFYFAVQNLDYLACNLLDVLQLESPNIPKTSLFFVPYLTQNNELTLKSMTFTQNICLRCQGGLFQVLSIFTEFESVATGQQNELLITADHIKCMNNIIGYYGCLTFSYNSSIWHFEPEQLLVNKPVGSRLLQLSEKHVLQIANSLFQNNKARIGSGLFVCGVSTLLAHSNFQDNQASLIGGAMFFQNVGDAQLYVFNNTFQSNRAQVGGALYTSNTRTANIDKLKINFHHNVANYSNNLLEDTFQQTISIVEGQLLPTQRYRGFDGDRDDDGLIDSTEDLIRDNITLPLTKIGNYPKYTNLLVLPSGQPISSYSYFYEYTQEYVPFEFKFRIMNLNRFQELVVNDEASNLCEVSGRIQDQQQYNDTLVFTNNFTNPQKFAYNLEKKGYDLDDMIVSFDPLLPENLYLELRFICNTVKIPLYNGKSPYQIINYNQNYELFANLRTFPCQKGEAYQLGRCIPCDVKSNQYSVTLGALFYIMDQIGQSSIKLKKGFWRPDYSNNEAEECSNLRENCLGGWVPGNPSCYEGHIGGLCESCDLYATVYEESYTQSSPYKCAGCKPTEQLNLIVLIATSFVSFISMILAVKGSYLESQTFIVQQILESWGILMKSSSSDLATLMKVLTNYFQIIQFIATFQIDIPKSATQAASTAGNPTAQTTTSMDCLFVTMSDIDVLYFRMVWALIQPSFYLIGFLIVYFTAVLLKQIPYKVNIVTTAFIYQFLLLQPTYVDGFIVLASPRTISGYPYVQRDVAYRYDSAEHSLWMAKFIGPMLGVWAVFLPLLLMFLLWRNRKTLDTKMTRLIYGFFYSEYELNSYLWEFIKIFQKELMVIILAYYDEKVTVKGMLLVLVMFLYGAYQISVSPYRNNRLNNLDRASTVILAISLCLGVLMKSCQDNGFGYLLIIILIVLVFINLPFLVVILYFIFEGYLEKFGPMLDIVRDKINEKYPKLKDKNKFVRKLLTNQEKMALRVKQLWATLRENVWEAKKICKEHDLKFKKVFPPFQSTVAQEQLDVMDKELSNKKTENLETWKYGKDNTGRHTQHESMLITPHTIVQRSGVTQSGIFVKQCLNGRGFEKWPDDTTYEGDYLNGKKHGYGKLQIPAREGDTQAEQYEGNFVNDQFEGAGVYKWADGRSYEGQWKAGLRHGYGVYRKNESKYEGWFEEDRYHGNGRLTQQQRSYEGKWVQGKLDGVVTVKQKNRIQKGEWKEGKFVQWID